MTNTTEDKNNPPRGVDLSRGGFPFNTTWTVADSWKMRELIAAGCRFEAVACEFIGSANRRRGFSREEILRRYLAMTGVIKESDDAR